MKKLIALAARMLAFGILIALLCVSCARKRGGAAVDNVMAGETGTPIFPAEHDGDPSHNTGESRLSVLKSSGNNMITSFRFEKGARNYWHVHPGAEQTLMVIGGEAYYQEEGGEKRLLRAGDLVVTKADVKHWNGASENAPCDCLTISENNGNAHVVWFDPVTDEEFKR